MEWYGTRCHHCESFVTNCHCEICDVHLCKTCVGDHIFDGYSNHDIVAHEQQESTLLYPKCLKHSTKQCELHCEQCDTHICAGCISSEEHPSHKKINIEIWLKNIKHSISKDLQELVNSIIPKHVTYLSSIPCQRDDIGRNAVQIITALNKQGENLHREIDTVIKKLKADLYEMDSKHLAFLEIQEDEIKRIISIIEEIISYLKSLLVSNDICQVSRYESRNAEFRNPPYPTVTLPNFEPAIIGRRHIYQQLGWLSKLSIKIKEGHVMKSQDAEAHQQLGWLSTLYFKIEEFLNFQDAESFFEGISVAEEPTIVTDMHTDYGVSNKLRSITALTDDEIWTCGENKMLKLYNLRGELLKTIQTSSKNTPSDIEVTRSGDLVYADYNDLSISIVQNEEISEVIKLRGWRPRNVCSTLYGEFLVFMDSENDRQSKIVRYCGTNEKQSIGLNDKGQPLYSYGPSFKYMSENKNLDICVADWGASAVVVVNYAGKHRFTYTGPPSSSSPSTKGFDPYGITTDSHSRIIIADCFNHRIHILQQNGQFVCFIRNCSLDHPVDLCVDSQDNLFVAERFTGKVKKIHYRK